MTFSKYYYYILDSDTRIKIEKISRENVHKNEKTTSKMISMNWKSDLYRIHHMLSPICFTNFFNEFISVWAIEKRKQTFYHWSQMAFFSPFVIWKRKHNKYSLKNPDSEFKTGETIWWICYWIWNKISRCILMHTAGIQIKLQLLNWFWHRSVSCMAHLMQNSKLFFSGLSQCGEILLKLCILIFK